MSIKIRVSPAIHESLEKYDCQKFPKNHESLEIHKFFEMQDFFWDA